MFLLYLDASGTSELADHTRHYVLVGAAVHENTWFALNKRLRGLRRKYAFPNEDFEIHVRDFNVLIREQDEISGFESMSPEARRSHVLAIRKAKLEQTTDPQRKLRLKTKHRSSRPFIHLSRQERSQLYEEALDLIGGHKGLVLFGEAIEKQHPAMTAGGNCVSQAFEQVIARFDAYLRRRAQWQQLSRARLVHGNKGLIVMDRCRESERDIQAQFANYRDAGHRFGQLEYVVDAPFLWTVVRSPAYKSPTFAPMLCEDISINTRSSAAMKRSNSSESLACSTERVQNFMDFVTIRPATLARA
jgi:hypothetical protein